MRQRSEIPEKYTYHLNALFVDDSTWDTALKETEKELSELQAFAGRLSESPDTLETALRLYLKSSRQVEKIYAYARLNADTNLGDSSNQARLQLAMGLYTSFSAAVSFIRPELIEMEAQTLSNLLEDQRFVDLKRMVNDIVRFKPHTLSRKEEHLLSQGMEVFIAPQRIFSQLNDVDLTFKDVVIDGENKPLTHGTYSLFLKHKNREVRESAHNNYYEVYEQHKNSLSSAYTASVQKDLFISRVRHYNSTFERALFDENINREVYLNLIDTISNNLQLLHRYHSLRKKTLGVSTLKPFDLWVPLAPNPDFFFTYEDAARLVVNSLQPLGEDYVNTLKQGLLSDRWVDVYETQGKRSGAFSFPCYDGFPYILMNFNEKDLRDVFTLSHEAGHSMHSYYSIKNQHYQDYGYTIFVAEVASTFNEQFLTQHLINKFSKDNDKLSFILNNRLDDINATLFRQTLFAEFELAVHLRAEKRLPLTLDFYRGTFRELLVKYYGSEVALTDIDDLICFRIPHFYSAFYVYKYATGIAAALALARQVTEEGEPARERYLSFLRAGCSKYPLELLRDAGVDMGSQEPIKMALTQFEELLNRLETVL